MLVLRHGLCYMLATTILREKCAVFLLAASRCQPSKLCSKLSWPLHFFF